MPNETGFSVPRSLADSFDSMDLIGTKKNYLLTIVVQNTVFAHHQVRSGNIERSFGKSQIVLDRLIHLVNPTHQELFIHVPVIVGGDVARLLAVTHDKHLHQAHQTTELAFFAVFRDLTEGIHKGMVAIL